MHPRYAYQLGTVLISLILIFSCKKDVDKVYADQLTSDNDSTLVLVTDTISILSTMVYESAQTTFDTSALTNLDDKIIGYLNDPVFGITDASLLFEMMPVDDEIFLCETEQIVDASLTMEVKVDEEYGDLSNDQKINVYLLENNLTIQKYTTDLDVTEYFSETSLIGSASYDNIDSSFSVTLSKDLAYSLIGSEADTIDYSSSWAHDYFASIFKGLCITGDKSNSSLFKIDPDNISMQLAFTYQDSFEQAYNNVNDTINFELNSDVILANSIDKDYTNTNFDSNSLMYVQGVVGIKTKLEFPYLGNFVSNENIAVLKAQLVINSNTTDAIYSHPIQLMLGGVNDDGTIYTLDDSKLDSAYFDGGYDDGIYKFNINKHIQKAIYGEDDGIYLQSTSTITSMQRVILNNEKHQNRLKLILTYSKL